VPAERNGVPGSAVFRAALYGLLAFNVALFAVAGTFTQALDTAAWWILLVLFDLESRAAPWTSRALPRFLMRALRLLAAAGVAAAALGYLRAGEWLDAANACLWIAVVILLEAEVRKPEWAAAHRRGFTVTATVLYSALAALILAWGWKGAWLDAYDALLWLIAFGTLEMGLLRRCAHGVYPG
jgi:small-conductance mechanosensitive channel